MKKYYFYKATNLCTNKSYVGYTGESVSLRWTEHIRQARLGKLNSHFYNSIRKYGEENWLVEEIYSEVCSKKVACAIEVALISEHRTFEAGLNMTKGGIGGDLISKKTVDEKLLISKKAKTTKIKNYGSLEWTDANWNYFNSLTVEDRGKINLKRSETLKKQRVEHGEKISAAHAKRSNIEKSNTGKIISEKVKDSFDKRKIDEVKWNEYISSLSKRLCRAVATPHGIFESLKDAVEVTGIPSTSLRRKIADPKMEQYYYVG